MRKTASLLLIILLMSITLLAPAEDLRPEITAASWSDEQDGVLITFRKNGIEGDYKVACRLGAKDEPWSSGGANGISDSGDTVEYFWKTGNLVPGETSSFWIDVVTPDGTTVVSDEAEVTVPLANAVSPIKILEFSVPDLSASKLKKMREDLLTILLQYPDEPERYLSVCNDYYDEAVSAVFRSTGIVQVLVTEPDGAKACFWAGNYPSETGTDNYHNFAYNLADRFVMSFPVKQGNYTVSFYDWDLKCLIDTYSFNVVD